ncbi:hypothetical protein GL279_13960 [Paracoccus limosus]|jgi:hypothetical protein|uniref:Uncharacterized protein n=1 Tax=Paracoccus limosus TaxID=913252 RepID=A0A844HAC8_9RHOB|nr:hypothetical protein [Paracoccus limosus]MTH35707.1 hypothetical protein [Paracoccus limosus]
MTIDDIRPMADEVASLMAARFGGIRRGQHPVLEEMLRRRGGALPRRLRREARLMAGADRIALQPRLARQVDFARFDRAHKALTAYLRPLGQGARLQGSATRVAASVAMGLLVLGLMVVWLKTWRGL